MMPFSETYDRLQRMTRAKLALASPPRERQVTLRPFGVDSAGLGSACDIESIVPFRYPA
jgi:hypothetical protein